jgi:hypothetical protein
MCDSLLEGAEGASSDPSPYSEFKELLELESPGSRSLSSERAPARA